MQSMHTQKPPGALSAHHHPTRVSYMCSFSYVFEEVLDHDKRYVFVEFPHGVGHPLLTPQLPHASWS